jgi:hypothetical protein
VNKFIPRRLYKLVNPVDNRLFMMEVSGTYSGETGREVDQSDNCHDSYRCTIVDSVFRQAQDISVDICCGGLTLKTQSDAELDHLEC